MSKTNEEIRAAMIREKQAVGLSLAQATECTDRQLAHDEEVEAAEAKAAKKNKAKEDAPSKAGTKSEAAS